jgi:hypothetical protein
MCGVQLGADGPAIVEPMRVQLRENTVPYRGGTRCNGPWPLQAPLLEEARTWCSESMPIDERHPWSEANWVH